MNSRPVTAARSAARSVAPVDARLEEAVRGAVVLGAVLVALLPSARGVSPVLGWLPLWLLAMPLSAWWALHRFRLPAGAGAAPAAATARRTRARPAQARRPVRAATRAALARAA